jgi:thiamine pyrophosphate-dependent acetolactate synthase large subunit-like protein
MLSRQTAIQKIFDFHGDNSVYVTNTGYISREIYDMFPKNKNILYMQGSMGLSPAIALGIASSTEKDVVAFVGDASLLMHLGITHTIRDTALKNLFVYVLDNGCHESVGQYNSASLEASYVGINEIIKISCDGKKPRVGLSCHDNIKHLMEFINE